MRQAAKEAGSGPQDVRKSGLKTAQHGPSSQSAPRASAPASMADPALVAAARARRAALGEAVASLRAATDTLGASPAPPQAKREAGSGETGVAFGIMTSRRVMADIGRC